MIGISKVQELKQSRPARSMPGCTVGSGSSNRGIHLYCTKACLYRLAARAASWWDGQDRVPSSEASLHVDTIPSWVDVAVLHTMLHGLVQCCHGHFQGRTDSSPSSPMLVVCTGSGPVSGTFNYPAANDIAAGFLQLAVICSCRL